MSTATNIEAAFPLSPLQQGMLFHSLGAPGSAVYVTQIRCEVRGALQVEAFYQAWQRVLDRHQALRAAFVWEGVDEPMQVVGRRVRLPFRHCDWRGVPEAIQRRRLDAWARRDRTNGFTLSRAPLMRVVLAQLGDERYEIAWTYHHVVCDGWSRPILLGEFWRCYDGFAAREPVVLPPPRPYSQYIARLPRDLAASERFWRAQIGDLSHPTPLGVDRSALARVAPDGHDQRSLHLSQPDTAALEEWSRRHAVSLGTIVAAAWALVLSRYSRQDDVVFGVTVSGRSAAAGHVESLVGLCINTLPLRVRIRRSEPVVAWLRALQRQFAELREHEHTPLAQLHRWTGVEAGESLFESIVVFENFPVEAGIRPPGAPASRVTIGNIRGFDKTNYALTLIAAPEPEFLLMAAYDPARFATATIDALLGHLAAVLRGFTAGDQLTLGDVSLLTAIERAQVVTDWNTPAGPAAPTPPSLLDRLERQAAATPEAVAVVCDGQAVSYAALHARANRLAHVLRAEGVGPDVPVAICLGRSLDLIAALLGVWKAGGAYVPLDPQAPTSRLEYLVHDAGAPVLVSTAALGDQIPAGDERRVYLDADERRLAEAPDTAPVAGVTGASLAYVIYTSGSTGQPKGVGITHGNVASLFAGTEALFGFQAADTWTLFHSATFDFSVWEMWGALAYGGRLVVVPAHVARMPEAFAALARAEGVTVLNQTPSAFRALQSARTDGLPLRVVVFGGEALPFDSLRPWAARHRLTQPQLVNMYGITETTVHVTHHTVTDGDLASGIGSRIGRALPTLQLYLLDKAEHPVPVGVAGEIYVGGVGVARGYLGRPELTATRFVPDPFGTTPGARLYRSGDLGRWRADGVCEFLGRADNQVKLRGYRIEPGEIEAALREQPGVRDAVVVLREDAPGDPQLVAYVVAETTERVITDSLQQALGRRLPAYMVPSVIVALDRLPLTGNGKIDRRALPAPAGLRPTLIEAYMPPRNAVETALAEVWADVLRLDRVGIHDNFFALGGDSIRTIQVQAKARERGVTVSLEQLMRHQTIADLAGRLGPSAAEPVLVTKPFDLVSAEDRARLPEDVEDAYPLTELQAGMLFHSELDPESAVYYDVLSFRVRVPGDPVALTAALSDLIAAHPILRTSIHLSGYGEPLQFVHRHCDVPLQIHDVRHLPEAELDRALADWFEEERRNRFVWTKPPLFRLHVHRRPDDTLQCTLIGHHAILDGWSVAAFFTELFTSYLVRLGLSTAPVATAPTTTFREYVALERAAVGDAEQRGYWVQHLADCSATLVPRWPVRAGAGRGTVVSRSKMLPSDVGSGLARAAERAGVPLKSILLAGHLRVLAFVANEPDVVTGVVTHGRTGSAEADRVLGLFLNTLPLRSRIDDKSWIDLVRRVFDIECEQSRHRYFPMPTLLRLRGGQPLFDAVFNFMHFHVYQALVGIPHLEVVSAATRAETNFPLLTQCTLHGATGEVEIQLEANRALFPDEQVEQLLEYYERAYAAIAADPEEPCTRTLMSAAEREQIVAAWNRTDAARRLDRPVHDLIELQVVLRPDAIAVVEGGRHLTYAELWRRAGEWSAALHRLGVEPDACVGLCLPRSLDMAIAVLATWRASGAYVPLDPTYPDERLALMVDDASVRVLLTTGALAPRFAGLDVTVVAVGSDSAVLAGGEPLSSRGSPVQSVDASVSSSKFGDKFSGARRPAGTARRPRIPGVFEGGATPPDPGSPTRQPRWGGGGMPRPQNVSEFRTRDTSHLAYVMYTSGSTGRPKGIGLPHRCLTNLIEWHLAVLGGGARMLQFASLGFDASFHEIAATWCSGGMLHLVPEAIRADSQALARDIHDQAIEKVILPPVVLQQLAEHCGHTPGLFGSLRQIITTGEQLRLTQPVIDLLAALPACTLHNHYGPAETHVVTAGALSGPPASWPVHPAIGRPIDNTQIYVVDGRLTPVPAGTPGELYIGGVSLARGYYNRPDLTAERFVPDPFAAEPGGRLYRTGDLARWLPGGEIEFLGRIANRQVKLRGYRVELGEVEAAIVRHPGVRNAVVLRREYGPDDPRLVAYIVPSSAEAPTTSDLRAFIARTLPDFMLPAAFIAVDEFPLTPNGKIDRRRLPEPTSQGRPDLAAVFVAPRTAAEQLVAGMYRDVLRADRVGVDDDFFERGGHSLLATQAIVRIREAFGIDVPLRTLFERPTAAGMVLALADLLGDRTTLDEIAGAILEVNELSDAEVRARLTGDAASSMSDESPAATVA